MASFFIKSNKISTNPPDRQKTHNTSSFAICIRKQQQEQLQKIKAFNINSKINDLFCRWLFAHVERDFLGKERKKGKKHETK